MVDGHAIASEFQQKLYDGILAGNCVRCHYKDHTRAACKDAAGRWETKFDQEEDKYWTDTLSGNKKPEDGKRSSIRKNKNIGPTLSVATKRPLLH
jgi:hypothetical protein